MSCDVWAVLLPIRGSDRRWVGGVGEHGCGVDEASGSFGPYPETQTEIADPPDKAAAPSVDLVKRDFSAEAINQKWCGDLTEIPTDETSVASTTVVVGESTVVGNGFETMSSTTVAGSTVEPAAGICSRTSPGVSPLINRSVDNVVQLVCDGG